MTLANCILLASLLFSIGVYGLLTRRQAVAMLLCVELMLNAANIVFVSFAHFRGGPGQIFAIFALAITVAEVAVGLALVLLLYRKHGDTAIDLASETKG
ncbi:MAG: NADH-quinone oxidoreductase subunit NuoK [Planctomycetota bacterium]|nr:NADH-quinone oxidoreductase subunit NuoK [Planctomycetota bacterium]